MYLLAKCFCHCYRFSKIMVPAGSGCCTEFPAAHSSWLRPRGPGKADIAECLKKEPSLHQRNWRNVKDFIRNRIVQHKRTGHV